MKLTCFTEYSLRVLVHLAAEPARRTTVAEIAQAHGLSVHHLVKVVHFLGRHGWVATIRGKGGGILLGRPAAEIRLGEVVRDTQRPMLSSDAAGSEGGVSVTAGRGRLKVALGEAVAAFYAVLDGYTLADLAADRPALQDVLWSAAP